MDLFFAFKNVHFDNSPIAAAAPWANSTTSPYSCTYGKSMYHFQKSILKKPSISFSMLCSTRQICKRAPFYNTLFLPALTTWVASFKGRLAGLPNLWEFKSFGWSSLKSVNIYLWFLMKYIRNQVHQKAVYVTKRDTEINSIDFMVSYI